MPVAAVGGLAGGLLILRTSGGAFEAIVPWLLLGACALLAAQDGLRRWLHHHAGTLGPGAAAGPVLLASVYGGYFGAGLSVIFLAVLGLTLDDSLQRLNALKQALSLAANVAAAGLFFFSPELHWQAALVMAGGALLGGALGGRLASHVEAATLRTGVIAIGASVALYLLLT